jgi:NSS family neurotransmitter:Na+ symporter
MAMAGSAIGLGNIWRFPYIVGEHGGAAFIIAYIICSLFIAIPCFVCEATIGRRGRSAVYVSFEKLAPKTGWKYMGLLTVFTCFVLVSYYSVVGGWSLDFLVRSISGKLSQGSPDGAVAIFGHMVSSPLESVAMLVCFLAATAIIVLGGIKKGIELFTKYTTPLLFFLMVAMVIFSVSLPGASEGVKYLLRPDFSKLGASGWACALGQAFFSMSLGVGTVLIYSSFMKKGDSILGSGVWTSVSDTGFAVISGFAIMPAVFAAGIEPGAGPSLVYETLPYIFAKMGAEAPVLGYIITIVFFLAILMAALSSSISIFDVCVEHAVEHYKMKRLNAVLVFFLLCLALGVPCALSFGKMSSVTLFGKTVFDICDYLCSNVLMTLGALAFTLFVGWKMKKSEFRDEFTNGGNLKFSSRIFPVLYFIVRWVIPVVILLIFVSNL